MGTYWRRKQNETSDVDGTCSTTGRRVAASRAGIPGVGPGIAACEGPDGGGVTRSVFDTLDRKISETYQDGGL